MTPLSFSMEADSEQTAEFLIYRDDVEINTKDNFGWTALAHARCVPRGVSMFLTAMLLQQGATMDPDPEWYVMSNSTYPDMAVDMVTAMIGDRSLEAYRVERFGQEKVDRAFEEWSAWTGSIPLPRDPGEGGEMGVEAGDSIPGGA